MRAVASAIAIVLALFFSHYRGDTYSRDDTNANYYKNYFKRSHIFTPLSRNNLQLRSPAIMQAFCFPLRRGSCFS